MQNTTLYILSFLLVILSMVTAFTIGKRKTNWGWSLLFTRNASKAKFFSKDLKGVTGLTNVSLLTEYNSTFASVAYDASGRKHMLMTITGRTVNESYSTTSPFLVYASIDR